ncbi:FHA domain-containing protein [Streptomyces sp. NPDC014656]|uniref:FHA domain-containing protein n=1 Tax=Streptomyces sp. NPDC014656 TaxID=3364878 RepID=UPI0036FC9158
MSEDGRRCACGEPAMTQGQLVCHACFTPYALAPPRTPAPSRTPGPARTPTPPRTPDPSPTPTPAPAPTPTPAPAPALARVPAPAPTVRGRSGTSWAAGLRVEVAGGTVELRPGGSVTLGRDARYDPRVAFLADDEAFPELSRRHATVRLDHDGTAWVRDEGSSHHTYLDGRALPPHQWARLSPEASLSLTAALPVTLRVLGAG